MNETEPPVHPASQAEVDGSPTDVSSDPVKPRSAVPGAMLLCMNVLLAVIWFVVLLHPTEHVSGQSSPSPHATVVATDTVGLPPDATPTIDTIATATAVRGSSAPGVAPTSTIPIPTPAQPAATPTLTPTEPTATPTLLPGA